MKESEKIRFALLCISLMFVGLIPVIYNLNSNKSTESSEISSYSSPPQDLEMEDKIDNIEETLENDEIIYLKGTAEERGRNQGTKLKEAIQNNVQNFWNRIYDAGFSRAEALEIVEMRENALEPEDPDNFIEIHAMAEAAEVPYEDLLAFNMFPSFLYEDPELEHGCTAWVAHGTATASGNSLMHKNRDLDRDTQVVVAVAPSGSDNGYKAVVTAGSTGVTFGLNDQGLATGNTYVSSKEIALLGKDALIINREILEQCDNIDEIFTYLSGVTPQDGSNQMCADPNKVAIIEYTAQRYTTPEQSIIQNNVGYRANHFRILWDKNSADPSETNLIRYEAAKDFCEEKEGTLTILDFNELSRHHYEPAPGYPSEHDGVDGSISNYHTLSGGTFEINQDYPSELSVMWAALGTPCTALYTPIHLSAASENTKYTNSDAWDIAELILDQQDAKEFPFGSLIPHYLEIEAELISQATEAELTAYNYLEGGQTTQARAALTECDNESAEYVFEEMTRIYEKKLWTDSFHYLNGIESSTDIAWNDEEEQITLVEIIDPNQIITYDFSGVTVANATFNIYETDVDAFPFGDNADNRNDHDEPISDAEYALISVSDNSRWETDDPGSSDEMLLWVEMVINENIEDIYQIDFSLEGYSYESSDPEQANFYTYVLKEAYKDDWINDSNWIQVGGYLEMMNGEEQTFTVSLTEDFDEYIGDDGSITWLVGTPGGHSDQIYCDYIKMDVIVEGTGPKEYDTEGELTSESITHSNDWDRYLFFADHTLPASTDITYKILRASDDQVLATITSAEAESGYNLSAITTSSIKLKAELSTTNNQSIPILHDWGIIWPRPVSWAITINSPQDNQFFSTTAPDFNIEVSNPNTMWYTLNGGMTKYIFTDNDTIDQAAWNSLDDGAVEINFYANDSEGVIITKEVDIIKDSLEPNIQINTPDIDDFFGTIAPDFEIEIIESHLDTMWYTIDGGLTNITFTSNETIDQSEWNDHSEGMVSIRFYANDSAGNIEYADRNIQKDSILPMIVINNPEESDLYGSVAPTFEVEISDSHLDTMWYTLDGGLTNIAFKSNGSIDQNNWTLLSDGPLTIRFYANDSAGNLQYSEVHIEKDSLGPSILILNPLENDVFGSVAPGYTVKISDPNLDSMWYTLDGGLINITFTSNGSIDQNNWTLLSNGPLTIKFYANDTEGRISSNEVDIIKDISAPIITINSPEPSDLFGLTAPNYEVEISGANKMWYTVDGGLTNITFTYNGSIDQNNWTLLSDGPVTIRFYANNSAGKISSKSIIIEKDSENPIIYVNSPHENDLYGSMAPNFNVYITDANLDTMWYTIDGGLTYITFTSNESINQTEWVDHPEGLITIRFYANDSIGNIAHFDVNVEKDSQAPSIQINSPGANEFYGKIAPNFSVEIEDIHLNSKWYTFDDGANNYTFTENGQFNQSAWDLLKDGNIHIDFYAKDSLGNINVSHVIIKKDTVVPVIEIMSPRAQESFGEDSPYFTLDISDIYLASTWYTLDGGKTNITFDDEIEDQISQRLWEALGDGLITIHFYANDSAGNIGHNSIKVIKVTTNITDDDNDDEDLKNYVLFNEQVLTAIIIGSTLTIAGIGLIVLIKHRKRNSAVKYLLKNFSEENTGSNLNPEKEKDNAEMDLDFDFED